MDRADIKLGFLLAYIAAFALHSGLAAEIYRRHRRRVEVQLFAAANVVLAVWHLMQLAEFLGHAEIVQYDPWFERRLAAGQLVLGLLVVVLFFHLLATFERVYRRKAPSLRAAITTHLHRHQATYVPAAYVLLLAGGTSYLLNTAGVTSAITVAREAVGPASAYVLGGSFLFMTFLLFPARAGQEKILVPTLGRGLLMLSLAVSMGLVALWHGSHPLRTSLGVLPWLHLHSVFFCVFLALVRYEFGFMDRFILRGLRAGIWSAAVLAAYFAFNRWSVLAAPWGREAISVGRIGILLSAVALAPYLGQLVARWADRVLFARQVDLPTAARGFGIRLGRVRTLRELVDGSAADISHAVHAKTVNIVIGSSGESKETLRRELEGHDYRVRVPMGSEGWLLLGERRNLYPYFDGERDYLRLVAQLLGGAVHALRLSEHSPTVRGIARSQVSTSDLDSLEREVRRLREELQRARTELAELRERFDPELLHDVLEIADTISHRRPQEAVEVTRRLRRAYEYALDPSNDATTLEREMAFAQDYLALEKLRLRNRLDVELRYDSSLRHQVVPRRILQPLIENALKHGLARELRRGSVSIACTLESGRCRIQLRDNGRGFPAVHQSNATGGLQRVEDQLRRQFNEGTVALTIVEVDEGACIELEFPREEADLRRRAAGA